MKNSNNLVSIFALTTSLIAYGSIGSCLALEVNLKTLTPADIVGDNSYQLTAQDITDNQLYKLYFKNGLAPEQNLGPITLLVEQTSSEANHFNIDFYLGNDLSTTDNAQKLTAQEDRFKSITVQVKAPNGGATWKGDFRNRGLSSLTFVSAADNRAATSFNWDISSGNYISQIETGASPDYYIQTHDYAFKKHHQAKASSRFSAEINLPQGGLLIKEDKELGIHQGVTLTLSGSENRSLKFSSPDEALGYGGGQLTFHITEATNYPKLVVNTRQNNLFLGNLQFVVSRSMIEQLAAEYSFDLIEVHADSAAKICLFSLTTSEGNCPEQVRAESYTVQANDLSGSQYSLVATISADQKKVSLQLSDTIQTTPLTNNYLRYSTHPWYSMEDNVLIFHTPIADESELTQDNIAVVTEATADYTIEGLEGENDILLILTGDEYNSARSSIEELIVAMAGKKGFEKFETVIKLVATQSSSVVLDGVNLPRKTAEEMAALTDDERAKFEALYQAEEQRTIMQILEPITMLTVHEARGNLDLGNIYSLRFKVTSTFDGKVSWTGGDLFLDIRNGNVTYEKTEGKSNIVKKLYMMHEDAARLTFSNAEDGIEVLQASSIKRLDMFEVLEGNFGKIVSGPVKASDNETYFWRNGTVVYFDDWSSVGYKSTYFSRNPWFTYDYTTVTLVKPITTLLDLHTHLVHPLTNKTYTAAFSEQMSDFFALLSSNNISTRGSMITDLFLSMVQNGGINCDTTACDLKTVLKVANPVPSNKQVSYTFNNLLPLMPARVQDFTTIMVNRVLLEIDDSTTNVTLIMNQVIGSLKITANHALVRISTITGDLHVTAASLIIDNRFSDGDNLDGKITQYNPEYLPANHSYQISGAGSLQWDEFTNTTIPYSVIVSPSSPNSKLLLIVGDAADETDTTEVRSVADGEVQELETNGLDDFTIASGKTFTINAGATVVTNLVPILELGAKIQFGIKNQSEFGKLVLNLDTDVPLTLAQFDLVISDAASDLSLSIEDIELASIDGAGTFTYELPRIVTGSRWSGLRLGFSEDLKKLLLLRSNVLFTPDSSAFPQANDVALERTALAYKDLLLIYSIFEHTSFDEPNNMNLAAKAKVGWIFTSNLLGSKNVATTQSYNISFSKKLGMISGNLAVFYNNLTLQHTEISGTDAALEFAKATKKDELIGTIVQLKYTLPTAGLTAGGLIGGAISLDNYTYKTLVTGLQIGYQIKVKWTAELIVNANFQLDFAPLFTKQGESHRKDLFTRAKLGLAFAINSGSYFSKYKISAKLPVALLASFKNSLGAEKVSYSNIFMHTGLITEVNISDFVNILAGYRVHIGQKFVKHTLDLKLQFNI